MQRTTSAPEPALDTVAVEELASALRIACARVARRARTNSPSSASNHYAILTQLMRGPLSARGLAEFERVAAPTITRKLNALERAGFVDRESDSTDGRRVQIRITAAGAEVQASIKQDRNGWVAAGLRNFTNDELKILVEATRLLERLDGAEGEAP